MNSLQIVAQVFKKKRTGSYALKRHRRTVLFVMPPTTAHALLVLSVTVLLCGLFGGEAEPGSSPFLFPQESSKYTVVFETGGGVLEMDLEAAIACMLPAVIPVEYEEETLKAQAVLLRTALLQEYARSKKDEPYHVFFKEDSGTKNYFTFLEQKKIYGADYQEKLSKYRHATLETSGIYLRFKTSGSPSWFCVSAGVTREGILCKKDYQYRDFYREVTFTRKEFERTCRELLVAKEEKSIPCEIHFQDICGEPFEDEQALGTAQLLPYGRILQFLAVYPDGTRQEFCLEADRFIEAFHLPSPCVEEILETKREFTITVKGVGHGSGMSQFAANELAKEGKDYTEILSYFFTNIAIDKFE